jgi:hypothetical protein
MSPEPAPVPPQDTPKPYRSHNPRDLLAKFQYPVMPNRGRYSYVYLCAAQHTHSRFTRPC